MDALVGSLPSEKYTWPKALLPDNSVAAGKHVVVLQATPSGHPPPLETFTLHLE
jgi:hypothetical protein